MMRAISVYESLTKRKNISYFVLKPAGKDIWSGNMPMNDREKIQLFTIDITDIYESSSKLFNTESKIFALLNLCIYDQIMPESLPKDELNEYGLTKTDLWKASLKNGLKISKKNFIDNLNQLENYGVIIFKKAPKYNKTLVTLNKKKFLTKMENHIYATQKLLDRLKGDTFGKKCKD